MNVSESPKEIVNVKMNERYEFVCVKMSMNVCMSLYERSIRRK